MILILKLTGLLLCKFYANEKGLQTLKVCNPFILLVVAKGFKPPAF